MQLRRFMENELPTGFRKKIYTKLTTSQITSSLSQCISQNASTSSQRKLSVTEPNQSICHKLKELFLPLMIDIFELRQATSSYNSQNYPDELIQNAILKKHPEEILQNLESLELSIKEAKHWCEGALMQIEKASKEARQMLSNVFSLEKDKSFIDSVIRLFDLTKKEKNGQGN